MDLEPIIKELHGIYDMVPGFKCRPKCTDCCGPIFFSGLEWHLIEDKRMADSIWCPYRGKGFCEIYEQRPIVCRLYGAVDHPRLTCSFGHCPTFKISNDDALWLVHRVGDLSARAGFEKIDRSSQMLFDLILSRPTTNKMKL